MKDKELNRELSCFDCERCKNMGCATKNTLAHYCGMVDCMAWGVDKPPFNTWDFQLILSRNIAAHCKEFDKIKDLTF